MPFGDKMLQVWLNDFHGLVKHSLGFWAVGIFGDWKGKFTDRQTDRARVPERLLVCSGGSSRPLSTHSSCTHGCRLAWRSNLLQPYHRSLDSVSFVCAFDFALFVFSCQCFHSHCVAPALQLSEVGLVCFVPIVLIIFPPPLGHFGS